jgi:integrase
MATTALTPDQITALRALLAEVDSDSAQDQCGRPLCEIGIAVESSGASPSPKGKTMRRIHGPYPDRNGWRIKVVDRATGKSVSHTYPTEAESRKEVERLRREAAREIGISIDAALVAYEKHVTAKGNRPRSVTSTLERLRSVFAGHEHRLVALDREDAKRIWADYKQRPTRMKKAPAIDTQMNTLHETRTFMRWCRKEGWCKTAEPFADIEVVGQRSRGKDQLDRLDDARRWLGTALELGAEGDIGRTAAATALLMGMRASEVTDRLVRDIDDDGRVLVIPHAKTRAGVRRLRIPEVLQPLLAALATNTEQNERLFGPDANRYWLRLAVRRICRSAKTPIIGPHGLRGTHATLAVQAGVTGDAVAAALGHESFAVTAGHYAKPEAVASARMHQIEANLDLRKFRGSSAPKKDAA